MKRALAGLLLLTLAACGGAATAPPTNSPAAASASAAAPASAAAKPAFSTAASAKPSAAASGAAAASAAAKPASSASGQTLTIPYSAISVDTMPFLVGFDGGLYDKYGASVKTEYIATSTTVTQAMLAGQTPIANSGEDAVLNADLNGADVVIIASGVDKLLFKLYVAPTVKSVDDLKGKKLGITRVGASIDFATRLYLRQQHMDPDKDVTLVQLGGVPEILAGIKSGAIDGGFISPPTTTQAKQLGLSMLADLEDSDIIFYQGPLVSTRAWVKAHHDQALNVMKGYVGGVARIYQDKEATKQVIGKYTKTTDAEVLEDSYQALLKALPKVPTPKVEGIRTGLDEQKSPAAKSADPHTFIDSSLIDELQKSGFIDSLYK